MESFEPLSWPIGKNKNKHSFIDLQQQMNVETQGQNNSHANNNGIDNLHGS